MTAKLSNSKTVSSKDEIRALTGIRAFAAVWVVGYHFYTQIELLFPSLNILLSIFFKSGHLGVDLFFMLSGFIIAYNYQEKLYPFRLLIYRDFLWARLSRLYPVHLATLLACLGLFLATQVANINISTGSSNWGAWDFVANLLMVHAWTFNMHPSWNFPSWSISCEWMAYLSFPLMAWFAALQWKRLSLWLFVSVILLAQLGLSLIDWSGMNFAFARIVFEFPVGVCLFQLYRIKNEKKTFFSTFLQPFIALALGSMIVSCAVFELDAAWIIPLLALLIYSLAIDSNTWLSCFFSTRVTCYWGRVSYSLYMTHAVSSMVLIRLLPFSAFEESSAMIRVGVCILYFGSVAAVAMFVYHAIEEPVRRKMRLKFCSNKTGNVLGHKIRSFYE